MLKKSAVLSVSLAILIIITLYVLLSRLSFPTNLLPVNTNTDTNPNPNPNPNPNTNTKTNTNVDIRPRIDIFARNWPHVRPLNESVELIKSIPPQITIAKVCSMCTYPFWMALPTHFVLRYHYFAGGNAMLMELATGVWDTAETRLANAVLAHGCRSGTSSRLMVDVGMNHGYFSAMALAAGCRVVAFEPTKYHQWYTNLTVALSGHEDRFKLHAFAASDTTGVQVPFDDWSVIAAKKTQEGGASLNTVATARVDDFVHEDILYLKVDVEGNEPAVFKGLTKLLKTKVILVILWEQAEANPKSDVPLPKDYLQEHGYFISEHHHGGGGNFIALHPNVDPILRQTIMAMKEININETFSASGTDWWKF